MWSEVPIIGGSVLIDDADLPLLDGRTWYVATTRLRSGRSYQHALSVARRGEKAAAPVRMHRLIMGVSDPKVLVDHINRNPLDNRRANLRLASKSQNTANGRAWGKSKYRGVTWDKDNSRWRAAVFKNGRRIHIGRFDTEEEAARAYDAVAREHHAEFAALNFSAAKRPLQSHQRDTTRHKPAPLARSVVAALFVEKDGAYYGLDDVDPWDIERDARKYAGPHPVVAHPPCERWGRFWHGSTRKPHQYKLGDDGGCFAAALSAVRRFGGVLEHPADSHAWSRFNLNRPTRGDGWLAADMFGGWTCYVEQGHYGHFARKPTWLYAVGASLPELNWSRGEQRLHPTALERHGYAKARRIGMVAMVGGKDKKRIRDATPPEFRDLLLSIARSAARSETRTTT